MIVYDSNIPSWCHIHFWLEQGPFFSWLFNTAIIIEKVGGCFHYFASFFIVNSSVLTFLLDVLFLWFWITPKWGCFRLGHCTGFWGRWFDLLFGVCDLFEWGLYGLIWFRVFWGFFGYLGCVMREGFNAGHMAWVL